MSLADAVPRLFALAARRLGWSPGTFWQATPADLLLALGPAEAAAAPMTRTDLARLMEHDTHG